MKRKGIIINEDFENAIREMMKDDDEFELTEDGKIRVKGE